MEGRGERVDTNLMHVHRHKAPVLVFFRSLRHCLLSPVAFALIPPFESGSFCASGGGVLFGVIGGVRCFFPAFLIFFFLAFICYDSFCFFFLPVLIWLVLEFTSKAFLAFRPSCAFWLWSHCVLNFYVERIGESHVQRDLGVAFSTKKASNVLRK